jgi:hypothetical protein
MLDFLSPQSGVSRRDFIRVGSLGLAGFSLADLLRARAVAGQPARKQTAVVLLFLDGGASQHETFDPKPDAPKEYRCIFDTVRTTLPGVVFSSLMTRMAQHTDKLTIVRSFTHRDGAHEGAQHWIKTGYPYPEQFVNKAERLPDQNPAFGSIVARHRGPINQATGVPNYVRVFHNTMSYHDGPAWLGQACEPFKIGDGINTMLKNMALNVAPNRLDDRRALLQAFDTLNRELDRSGAMNGMDVFQQQAVDIVLGKAKEAFDLSREPAKTRAKYRTDEKRGPGIGNNLLLARRLCEAGCGFVSLNIGYWDHHGGLLQGCKDLGTPLDHGVSAFLEDIEA